MKIKIKILGNADDLTGNPLAKLRMTGPQHWRPEVQRYVRWKNLVRTEYWRQTAGRIDNAKPLTTTKEQPMRMDIKIKWKNDVHADPEGVFGSIADALFENDKYLKGTFDFESAPAGRGEVEITITDDARPIKT